MTLKPTKRSRNKTDLLFTPICMYLKGEYIITCDETRVKNLKPFNARQSEYRVTLELATQGYQRLKYSCTNTKTVIDNTSGHSEEVCVCVCVCVCACVCVCVCVCVCQANMKAIPTSDSQRSDENRSGIFIYSCCIRSSVAGRTT